MKLFYCILGYLVWLSVNTTALSSISLTVGSALTKLHKGVTNKSIGRINVRNNNINGFEITVASTNNGKLIRQGTTGTNPPDYLNYTITFQQSASTWYFSTNENLIKVPLQITPYPIYYDIKGTQSGTSSGYLTMLFNSSAKSLWAATYKDTIRVTIINL